MIRPPLSLLALGIAAALATGASAAPSPALFDALAQADVVVLGEQHDDAAGHRFELRVLEELHRRGRKVVLAMEMFERDQQPLLAAYVGGKIVEAHLLQRIEPWPNYKTDYRPLVEFARAQGWTVVGSDVPRRLATQVSRGGLKVLARLPRQTRRLVARDIRCPDDAYRRKFAALMTAGAGHGGPKMNVGRFYLSQCVKDETMAETVAGLVEPGVTVVHINGAFHSEGRLGIVPRIERRRPGAKVVAVAIARKGDPSSPDDGDFVVKSED